MHRSGRARAAELVQIEGCRPCAAVEESPEAAPNERPKVRVNVETVIRQLNDLGIVVDEWPAVVL